MGNPLYIAVTPETHAAFVARQDELGLGSDEFVRQLIASEREKGRAFGSLAEASDTKRIAAMLAVTTTFALRDIIVREREAGRAFGAFAEAARHELARRGEQA